MADADGEAVDVVWDGRATHELRAPRVETENNHGSGCTFASAIAAGLARRLDVAAALDTAKEYVSRAIAAGAAWDLGKVTGP